MSIVMAKREPTEILVTCAQQGDRSAFDELAERYHERLLESICVRFQAADGSLFGPEDIANETLMLYSRGSWRRRDLSASIRTEYASLCGGFS